MDGLQLDRDYIRSVQNTVLDFAACSQYDPHLDTMQRRHPRHCRMSLMRDANMDMDMKEASSSSPETHADTDTDTDTVGTGASNEKHAGESVKIDANTIICRKALFGKCNDPQCDYQHLSGRANLKVGNRYRANQIRTVAVETRKERGFVVVLPVESHPLPPLPVCGSGSGSGSGSGFVENDLKRNVDRSDMDGFGSFKEENENVDIVDFKRRRVEDDDGVEEVDTQPEDVLPECVVAHDDSDDVVPSAASPKDGDSPCEGSGSNDLLENKSKDEINGFGSEEDYIGLPALDNGDGDGETQISTTIKMVLSECEDDSISEEHTSSDDTSQNHNHDVLEEPSQYLRPLSTALSSFGFEITNLNSDECGAVSSSELRYIPDESCDGIRVGSEDILGQMMLETELLCSVTEAVNLCIHAGRVDLCNAILEYYEKAMQVLQEYRVHVPIGTAFGNNHLDLMQQLVDVLRIFVEDSSSGYCPFSPNCVFHIQMCLAFLSHFASHYHEMMNDYHQEYSATLNEEFETTSIKLSDDIDQFQHKFKTFEKAVFPKRHMNTNPNNEGDALVQASFSSLLSEIESLAPMPSDTSASCSCANLIHNFLLGQELAKGVATKSKALRDPQLIIESILFHVVNVLKLYSAKCRFALGDQTNKNIGRGPPSQLQAFLLFAPAIFTSTSAVQALINTDNDNDNESGRSNVHFSSRQEGIMIQMKHLLMQSIHLLDFSGIINDNMEGQLLLCPFFSLLSSLLLVSGSYTKTHVLLVNALYSAHIKSNWAIYSDLLWSLLIQLHSVFPLSGENSGSSRLHIDGSLEKLQNDLVSKPHAFGVCPSKIVLEGDSNIANYDRLNPMQQSEDRALEKSAVSGVHSFCSHISTLQSFRQEVETCKIDLQLTNTSFPLRVTEFPMSLCLIGRNLLSLSLMNLDLMSLPLTFGSVFRNLQVSNL